MSTHRFRCEACDDRVDQLWRAPLLPSGIPGPRFPTDDLICRRCCWARGLDESNLACVALEPEPSILERITDRRERGRPNPADFVWALHCLQCNYHMRRAGWNGKGMWICLVTPDEWEFLDMPVAGGFEKAPFIIMKTADGKVVPWLASQTDLLATDWEEAT